MKSSLNISFIQQDLHWQNIDANLAMFEERIWTLSEPTDLIVLPEMFTTGFTMNPKLLAEVAGTRTFRWMQQQAAQTRAVIMGSYMIKEAQQFFNRLYAVWPDGSSQYYDKKHLFGLANEDKAFTPGTKQLTINVHGWRIRPLICYDLRFPVWARSKKTSESAYEYDLLIYVANWPKPRINAWDTLLAARAIENTSYCLGVNRIGTDGNGLDYPGHSALYDFKGMKKLFSESKDELQCDLDADALRDFREHFPFQADADSFSILPN